jgi:hypothetical protein
VASWEGWVKSVMEGSVKSKEDMRSLCRRCYVYVLSPPAAKRVAMEQRTRTSTIQSFEGIGRKIRAEYCTKNGQAL